MNIIIVSLLWIACVAEVWAEEDPRKQDRLWMECGFMEVLISYETAKNASGSYPTEESIRTTVRSKLRAAQLYREIGSPWTPYVHLHIRPMQDDPDDHTLLNDIAFITLQFYKVMNDLWTGTPRLTPVWNHLAWAGTHRIYEVTSILTDNFIDEYLRINEPACQGK